MNDWHNQEKINLHISQLGMLCIAAIDKRIGDGGYDSFEVVNINIVSGWGVYTLFFDDDMVWSGFQGGKYGVYLTLSVKECQEILNNYLSRLPR